MKDLITKGKVEVNRTNGDIDIISIDENGLINYIAEVNHLYGQEEANANAELIAGCFNVTNECGLTPAELLAQRNELLDALKNLLKEARRNSFEVYSNLSDTHFENLAQQAIKNAEK